MFNYYKGKALCIRFQKGNNFVSFCLLHQISQFVGHCCEILPVYIFTLFQLFSKFTVIVVEYRGATYVFFDIINNIFFLIQKIAVSSRERKASLHVT